MFDAHIRDGHLHKAEPFFDTFHPFVLAQRSQSLRHGLEKRTGCNFRRVRGPIEVLKGNAARTNRHSGILTFFIRYAATRPE